MSIQGIYSGYTPTAFTPRVDRAPAVPVGRAAESHAPVRGIAPEASLPVGVAEGTDSALWGVLTSDERSFFARASASGPMTYGPSGAAPAQPSVSLGGRIDLKG